MNLINNKRKLIVGVFDSGIGGVPVYNKLNYQMQSSIFRDQVAIKYLGDTKNFPYGTKTTAQLEEIVSSNLVELSEMGCSVIAIACNTASYIYNSLAKYNFNPNILPILNLSADKVVQVCNKNVHVISSNYTAKVHAYKQTIHSLNKDIKVTESGEQLLIKVIEENDRTEINRQIERILKELPKDLDTLVLGCTHFSHIKDTLTNKIHEHELNIKIVEPTDLLVNQTMNRISKILVNTNSNEQSEIMFSGKVPEFLFDELS